MGYRNKVEFTIGRKFDSENKNDNNCQGDICIGFNVGNLSKGVLFVEEPDQIKVNSKESLLVKDKVLKIVKESGLEPYDRMKCTGFWRVLLFSN